MPKIKNIEFIRFVLVGILATAIHYGLYLLFLLWIRTEIAYTIGYIASFALNFILTNYFTFKTKPSVQRGLGFGFSHLVNYLLHISLLFVFLQMGVPEKLCPIPVIILVVPINFILVRYFFKKK